MSNQPTGDYRLVPWAYPPIPGGSDNSTAQEGPYDFTEVRAGPTKASSILNTSEGGYSVLILDIRIVDYTVNDSSLVSQVLWKFTPTKIVDVNGVNVTGAAPTVTGSYTASDFNTGAVHVQNSIGNAVSPWRFSSRMTAGNLQEMQADIDLTVVDSSGAELQAITLEVSA